MAQHLQYHPAMVVGRSDLRSRGRRWRADMPASMPYTMYRSVCATAIGASFAVGVATSTWANVITDWDEKAIAASAPLASVPSPQTPYGAYRVMGIVHAAMFDAVNSIERRYRPYLVQLST